MRNFFSRLRYRFSQFMMGRYGADQLSRFLMGVALVFVVLNIFLQSRTKFFYWAVWVLLLITYFRMFSKNYQKRYNENTRFLLLKDKVLSFVQNKGTARSADPNFKIYRCPGCRQKVRVPKGRGMIEITCPKCSRSFRKRT